MKKLNTILKGRIFGYLTVLGVAYRKSDTSYFRCKCKCGKIHITSNLPRGNCRKVSCGCYQEKRIRRYIYKGKKYNIADLEKMSGIEKKVLYKRIRSHPKKSLEEILKTPKHWRPSPGEVTKPANRKNRKIDLCRFNSVAQLARFIGVSRQRIYQKVEEGFDIKEHVEYLKKNNKLK